ncbi:hypothetical protein [Aliiroseovarius sp.]|uniref:hypothetical protein n=1 Tax=Aliiroseovarius sp. TaxID=1872442 RepID=UPI0026342753|nr:hypothetical protein [Aliiroseovarius sp.]
MLRAALLSPIASPAMALPAFARPGAMDLGAPAMATTETPAEGDLTRIEFSDPHIARFLTVQDDGRAMMRRLDPPLRTLLLGTCKEVE